MNNHSSTITRNIRLLLALAAALLMAIALTACGNDTAPSSPSNPANQSGTTNQQDDDKDDADDTDDDTNDNGSDDDGSD
ncbi:hypothetical protein, partial [Bifidobacterium jacchi]|uniref:hypothetical protein n=1 Tax=Bifidobacterium jacchi TaxID=2490545 RepID=UPI003BA8BA20